MNSSDVATTLRIRPRMPLTCFRSNSSENDLQILLRSSKQDFFAIHNKLRRGDIVGVTGTPGQYNISTK